MAVFGPELIKIAEEARRRFAAGSDPNGLGLRDWLVRGGSYFVVNSTRDQFTVEATDDSWSDANGADFLRLMWAARDSVLPRSAAAYDDRSIGWAFISCYYTGLYLALGILRLFGNGMMYMTPADADAIAVAPGTSKLEAGAYAVTVQLGARPTIDLLKKGVRGFHEGFWRHADERLKSIADDISVGGGVSRPFPPDVRTGALLSVEELRKWLGKPGVTDREIGWMSALRNEVNYRLTRNVWAPNYRQGGVSAARLRQDALAIIRGTRDHLGAQLQLDRDIRAMIERVCVLFRDVSSISGFPRFR
jgi:hypothetical protein